MLYEIIFCYDIIYYSEIVVLLLPFIIWKYSNGIFVYISIITMCPPFDYYQNFYLVNVCDVYVINKKG